MQRSLSSLNFRGVVRENVDYDYSLPSARREVEEPIEEKMRKNEIFANLVEALQYQLALKRSVLEGAGAPIEVIVDGIEEEEKEPSEEAKQQPLIQEINDD